MRIRSIYIQDLGGIEKQRFENIDDRLILLGKNAAGKTSAIRAMLAAVEGGNKPDLIRAGADEGIIKIEFDNDTAIQKTFRRDKPPLLHALINGIKASNPQTAINKILDSFSVNFLQFLDMKEDAKQEIILQSIPFNVDSEQVKKILPNVDDFIPAFDAWSQNVHGLEAVNELDKRIRDRRRDLNVTAKELDSHVNKLRESLPDCAPDEDGKSWSQIAANLRKEYDSLIVEFSQKEGKIINDYNDKKRKARDEMNRKIAEATEKIRVECDKKITKAETEKDAGLAAPIDERSAVDDLLQREAQAKTKAEAEAKAQGVLEAIETSEIKSKTFKSESEGLTNAMQELAEYQATFLVGSPVEGLEMKQGRLHVDGIPLSQVNTAKQIELAMRLAVLRASDIRVVWADGLEALDTKHRELIYKVAKENELFLIGSRTTDDETLIAEEKEL